MARILMIEDNPHNLDLMTYLLRTAGHIVDSAMTARDGVVAALAERPDLVVLDIHLPDASGFDVLDELRSADNLAGLTVVAVTANAMVGDRDRVLAAGFDGYLAKPIEPTTFSRSIDGFLPLSLRGTPPTPEWSTS